MNNEYPKREKRKHSHMTKKKKLDDGFSLLHSKHFHNYSSNLVEERRQEQDQ